MRYIAATVLLGVGCGRIGFEQPVASSADGGTDAPTRDARIDGTSQDATVEVCAPHPMLGASGCLTGPGPVALWFFHEVTVPAAEVPDQSGRGCIPLTNSAALGTLGLDTSTGDVASELGVAADEIGLITAAGAVSLEIWARTTTTPNVSVDIGVIVDAAGTRVEVEQGPSGTRGVIEGAGANIGSSLRDMANGTDHHLVVRDDGAQLTYNISGSSSGYAFAPSFAWSASNARIAFGPWTGTLIRAAVYDRALTNNELACLRTAGALAIP